MAEHGADDLQHEGEMLNMGHGGGHGMGERQKSQRDIQRQQEIDYYEEELSRLDDSFPSARQALELEIHRVRGGVMDMIDVINQRKCKVRCRIGIPQENFPGFNFVGKLLGQGGSTLKKLQEDCNVKMAILGRGSMRDPQKEQEAFESGDPKFQHLKQALHLQIDCMDAPEEAYYRISRAIYEVKNIMTPDPSEMAGAFGGPAPAYQGGGGFGSFGGGGRGRGRGGRGGGGGGSFGGSGDEGGESGGFRGGRGGRGRSSFGGGRGGPRGGGRGGGPGGSDNGHGGFGQDYGQSYGGGKAAAPPRGRGAPGARRPGHPYSRGM